METLSFFPQASFALANASALSAVILPTQPCEWRVRMRLSSTSAMMPTPCAISTALGCAPLMPPSPEVTNSFPLRSPSAGMPKTFLPALSMVLNVPCTMPCGPMYIQPPAVICP